MSDTTTAKQRAERGALIRRLHYLRQKRDEDELLDEQTWLESELNEEQDE